MLDGVTRYESVSHPQASSLVFVVTYGTDFALDNMCKLLFLWDNGLRKGPDKGPTGSHQCPGEGRKEERGNLSHHWPSTTKHSAVNQEVPRCKRHQFIAS